MSYFSVPRNLEEVWLSDGGSFTLKDHRGLTVFDVNENGDIRRKGRDIKI